MKKLTLFLLNMVVMALFSTNAFASTSTYYAKCTVHSTGNGLVYVNTANSVAGEYASEVSANRDSRSTNPPTVSFYRFVKPEAGYKFAGWFTNKECTGDLSKDSRVQFSAYSTDSNEPTLESFWAKFVKKDPITEVVVYDHAEAVVLNGHSEVSIEQADSVVVKVDDSSKSAAFVLRKMKANVGEETTTWEPADTVFSGEMTVKDSVARIEFSEPILLDKGVKYQGEIKVTDEYGVVDTITGTFNGSYAEPLISGAALVVAGEEVTLNEHSEISMAHAEAIKVNVAAAAKTATYVIRTMEQKAGEESTQWVVTTDTIASGEMSINTIAYAEFTEALTFNSGNKYQVAVTVVDGEKNEMIANYIINGSYRDPLVSEAFVSAYGVETTLSTHAANVVIDATSLGAVVDASVRTASYAIRNMKQENNEWVATDTIEYGQMSVHGQATADLKNHVIFVLGKKYMVAITAVDAKDFAETAEYIIDGGFEPEKDVPTFSKMVPGEEYYLYNVEYDGRFLAANDWNTRASISSTYGFVVKVASEADGKYSISNLNENKGNAWLKMFTDGVSSIWTDNNSGANCNNWQIVELGDNKYQITNSGVAGLLGAYNNGTDTRLYMREASETGFCSTWAFVTKADWEAYVLEKELATGDFSDRMSNDKAKWAGATGVYGGGAERYNGGGQPQGDIMVQTINNLPVGMYEVTFAAISNVARDLNPATFAGEGIAYAFANKTQKDIIVGTKAALNADDWTNGTITLTAKVDEDGILKYGIANHKAGSQWAVVKVVSLTKLEDYEEPMISEASLLLGDERVDLDEHSEIDLDNASGITAHVAPSVRTASYSIEKMQLQGVEWTPSEVVASGEMSINAIAYAEFKNGTINFENGVKYQITIEATDARMESEAAKYIVNGTYREPQISEAALVSNGVEFALNEHSEVSVEMAEAVSAKVAPSVVEASYVIRKMMEIAGQESSQWVATDTITLGEMSINGVAYAEFDEAINFEMGKKYQITINTKDAEEYKDTVIYVINGAYHIPLVIETALSLDGEETVLSTHNEVAVDHASSITAKVDASVRKASYLVRGMEQQVGEESTQWVVTTDTIAKGEMSINGTAYAEFKEVLDFFQGNKYMVTVIATDAVEFEETTDYIINGFYVEPLISETAIFYNGNETALNSHSEASVGSADGIATHVLASVREASYVIRNMMEIVGEESSQWIATDTIASGEMSINTIASAEFKEVLNFYMGNKYMITINASDAADREESEDYIINGTYIDPLLTNIYVSAFGIKTSLSDSDDAVINIEKLGANVFEAVQTVSYAIKNMKLEGNEWVATTTIAEGDMVIKDGEATAELENLISCEKGKKYLVVLTAEAEREFGSYEERTIIISGGFVNAYDYTVKMSNNQSDWVGATGSYNGGAERYNSAELPQGDILVQTINGLPAGKYEVTFAVSSNVTHGTHATGDGITYAFANETTKDIAVGTKTEINWDECTIKFDSVVVAEDGILKYGLANKKDGSQWAVAKAIKLILVEPYVPEEPMIREAAIVYGGEEFTLNTHSDISVKHSDAIIAKVAASVRSAYHVVRNMELKDNQWEATDVIAEGDMSINGIAYAADTLTFEAGKKYQVEIYATDAKNYSVKESYVINGAYLDPLITDAMIVSGADSLTLSTHSSISAEGMDYIQASVVGGVQSAKYSVFAMTQNDNLQWIPSETLRENVEMQLHGVASAEDSLIFYTGTRYAIEITAECPLGAETVQYLIDGAYVEPLPDVYDITSMYIQNADLTDALNGWTVNNFNAPNKQANSGYATEAYAGWDALAVTEYALTQKITLPAGSYKLTNNSFFRYGQAYNTDASKSYAKLIAGEASVEVKTLGSITAKAYANSQTEGAGVLSSGNAMYYNEVEFTLEEEKEIEIGLVGTFDEAKSWMIAGGFKLYDLNATEQLPVDYTNMIANNSFENGTEGWTLEGEWGEQNNGEAVKVGTRYVEKWQATGGLPAGKISQVIEGLPNGKYILTAVAHASAPGTIVFANEEIVAAPNGASTVAIETIVENGTLTIGFERTEENEANWVAIDNFQLSLVEEFAEPVIAEAILVDAEDNEFALNTHSAISMKEQAAMIVRFGEPAKVASATYAIQAIVGYDEETGAPILGVPVWGEFSISTFGYATQAYTYAYGVQYQITIEATLKDETVVSEKYLVNGAYEPEALEANITGEGTTLNVTYAVGTDLGDQYNEKPYILDAEGQKIEVAEYAIDNTTGGFFDPLNKIVISLNAALADGTYTLVLPAGMFIVNGGDLNEEWRYEFTVEGGTYTAINSIAGSQNVADGKYLQNGKITIVKDGVKYQLSGARK